MEHGESQNRFFRDRGHSAIKKDAKELLAQLSRGEIDTFIFVDSAVELFLRREIEFAKQTGQTGQVQKPDAIADAYDKVRFDGKTIRLRSSLEYGRSSPVITGGKDMYSAIENYFGKKNPEYEALAYPPFVNYAVHQHIGGIVKIPTDTNLHIVSLHNGLHAALFGGKPVRKKSQDFSDDEFHIDASEIPKIKKGRKEIPKDPLTVRREAVFSLLLLLYIAQMHAVSRSRALISESPIFYAQQGSENRFWENQLYGSSGSEGIEFCRGYFEKGGMALTDDLKDMFGNNADNARKLWDAICFIQGSLVQLAEFSELRNPILFSLVKGDYSGALENLRRAAGKSVYFRDAALRFCGHEFSGKNVSAPTSKTMRATPAIPVEMREAHKREEKIRRIKEAADKQIQAYERLKRHVGRFYCDKTLAGEHFPHAVYRIKAAPKTIEGYVTKKSGRQEQTLLEIQRIIIVPYDRAVNIAGLAVYKGKGGKLVNVVEFEKKLNNNELVDVTDRDGFLGLFPNIKNP